MILYLSYNADLLEEGAVAFVDDTVLIAEGKNFTETHKLLSDFLERRGGGFDWSRDHNSKFELSKTVIMDCTKE